MKRTLTRSLGVVATGALALALVAAHPAGSGDPGPEGNRGKNLDLTTQAAIDADDGTFGAFEGASGDVKLWVDQRNDRVCMNGTFDFDEEGFEVNALHIHEKDRDSANPQTGPVVASWDSYIAFRGGGITELNWCVGEGDDGFTLEQVRDLLNEAEDYYINAHIAQEDGSIPVIRAELDKSQKPQGGNGNAEGRR
jgi:hypothetical protein